jgi:hypothetical protein
VHAAWRPHLEHVVFVWAIWRVAQAAVLLASGGDLVESTFRWDGSWYLNLLVNDYVMVDPAFDQQQNLVFFPGLVWLTEPFAWFLGTKNAALVVTNLTSLSAFGAVYGALCSILDERTARRALVGLALWPASVFLTAYYSEGIFITTTALAVWAAHRERTWVAMVAALAAGTIRSIGFALGPILAVARVVQRRRVDRVALGYAASGPLGLALVCLTQARQVGDPFAWAKAQGAWGRTFSGPWVPPARGIHDLVEALPDIALIHLADMTTMVLVAVALIVLVRWHRAEPATWGLLGWGWAAWAAPLFSNMSLSQTRFALAAWPALAVLGGDDSLWARRVRVGAAVLCAAGAVAMTWNWHEGPFLG